MRHWFCLLALFVCLSALAEERTHKGSNLTKLITLPTFSEGIVFDKQGNAFISEPYGSAITRLQPNGEASIWAETDAPNGHKILADGTHLVCDGKQKAVLRLNADGDITEKAATSCGNHALRHPNDLTLDGHGGFYFTDPMVVDRDPIGRVCHVDANGVSKLVAQWRGYPNGIAVHPEGNILFVADSTANSIWSMPLTSPGEVGSKTRFAMLPDSTDGKFTGPDGITFSPSGNLFVAHFGANQVLVLNPDGKLIKRIHAGTVATSNVAIRGQELYITGGERDHNKPGALHHVKIEDGLF